MSKINVRSDKEKVSPEFKKYLGIGNFKVVAVNADEEILDKLGFQSKAETVKQEFNGEDFCKLTFYVINKQYKIRNKVTFLLNGQVRKSKSGRVQLINNYAQAGGTWEESIESLQNNPRMEWFSQTGLREAFNGEALLQEFLVSWCNVKNFTTRKEAEAGLKPEQLYFKNWKEAITAGDPTQIIVVITDKDGNVTAEGSIREYVEDVDNEVRLMLIGVEHDSKTYVNVCKDKFGRASSTRLEDWQKFVDGRKGQGYPVKGMYWISELSEWNGIIEDNDTPDEEEEIDGNTFF